MPKTKKTKDPESSKRKRGTDTVTYTLGTEVRVRDSYYGWFNGRVHSILDDKSCWIEYEKVEGEQAACSNDKLSAAKVRSAVVAHQKWAAEQVALAAPSSRDDGPKHPKKKRAKPGSQREREALAQFYSTELQSVTGRIIDRLVKECLEELQYKLCKRLTDHFNGVVRDARRRQNKTVSSAD